ncbi:MAG: DUF1028 domain-containing protein [Myxococcales bacterium]|nr:MAG: DUF1028 domain-containing protein [Myxococcales bacterium]
MTYSIVGADTRAGEVGGAGTSCLGGQDVYVIYDAVPGRGVVHAQASYSLAGRRRAAELLAEGAAPVDILQSITLPSFDRSAEVRQYGVVDVSGRRAAFTGSGTMPYAADHQGQADVFAYSVQGNILTSGLVLSQAAQAFEAGGCDLAERLMSALEAGALGGEGDSRCTQGGIPSDSAFLQVESPELARGQYLALRVMSSGKEDPLPLLRQQLDAWRLEHPCPQAPAPMPTPTMTTPAGADGGCGCALRGGGDAGSWLLGGLLIVAWLRQRATRQLRPIQPA